MISVVTFKWKPKPGYRSMFGPETVNTLARMVGRHYAKAHKIFCVTDDARGIDPSVTVIPLWSDHADLPSPHGPGNPSCYRRLKMFSAEARKMFGSRFIALDLDCVVTGDLAPIFDRPEDFVIWADTNPTSPYNGSLILQTAGARRQVWDEFDPATSPAKGRALNYFGSDQAWIGACLGPDEAKFSQADGVYSYRCHLKPRRGTLPNDARLVMFHGAVDPWSPEARRLDWVRRYYC